MTAALRHAPPPPMTAHSVSRTHVGRVRPMNEDRLLDCEDAGLWAVADGMGGHRGGDIAAEMTVAALRELTDGAITPDTIVAALERANAQVFARATQRGVIGSTVVALHIDGDQATVVWAGDSRAYLIRGGHAIQLTTDHSVVQELIDAGAISGAQAGDHPRANVITRAIGVEDGIAMATRRIDVRGGDVFLLCSDGFSRSLHDGELGDIAGAGDSVADALLARTLDRDGSDNITFQIVALA